MKNRIQSLACALGLLCLLAGCTTVPMTGRKASQWMPSDQLSASASAQFSELKKKTPISKNAEYNAMVRRVGERIAQVAGPDIPDAEWEFVVFEDDEQLNAFAMPGGKVAVYTGLIKKIVRTDDDLAVVMGHEVAHVAAGHGNERVTHQMIAAGGAMAAGILTKDMDRDQQALIMAAYGAGSTVGLLLPYSRYHESEADEIGLLYAAKAGYDPRASIGFWQRMEAESKGASPPEFLSTHPSSSTRVSRLQELMPKALELYEAR